MVQVDALGAEARPVIITQNEWMRRMKEMSRYQSGMAFYAQMPDSFNLVLNSDHELVKRVLTDSESATAETLKPIESELKGQEARLAAIQQQQDKKKYDELTQDTLVRNSLAKKNNPEEGSNPAVNHALLNYSEENNTPGVFKPKAHKAKWSLNLTDISNPERSFSASGKSEFMVGRKAQNDICIPDDGYVSGVHCKFEKEGDTIYVTDMESSNGTKVNGNRISERTPVTANDIVRIGKVEYKITT